jgi:hypothetical protein
MRLATLLAFISALVSVSVSAQNLIVDGTSVPLAGIKRYDHVCVINGGRITVEPYDGADKLETGNLELIASTVYVDSSSHIDARGAGYSGRECYHGNGPTETQAGAVAARSWTRAVVARTSDAEVAARSMRRPCSTRTSKTTAMFAMSWAAVIAS